MADETLESVATSEQQTRAEAMGWIPPTRYKGDPTRYIDADAFLERGETVMPILKENNKRLQAEIAVLRETSGKQTAALVAAQDAIEHIEERHSVETQKAVERARAEVKRQLAEASREGDHEGVAELTDQLTLLNKAEAKAEAKVEAVPAFEPPPELREWNAENAWFGTDKRKTALALGIAQELRDGGELAVGRVFFDKVKAEMEAMLGEAQGKAPGKVEGARNGTEGDTSTRGKKSFSAMPKDAQEACDADARQFVGPTKRYKTLADWRSQYATIYFEGS